MGVAYIADGVHLNVDAVLEEPLRTRLSGHGGGAVTDLIWIGFDDESLVEGKDLLVFVIVLVPLVGPAVLAIVLLVAIVVAGWAGDDGGG